MATEKRLIDANELKRIYSLWVGQLQAPEDKGDLNGVETCIAVLNDLPTVDAVEVVHGRWEEWWSEEYITYFHKCSVCGYDAITKEETCHDEVLSNYCPNCGAKMDGDGNENV